MSGNLEIYDYTEFKNYLLTGNYEKCSEYVKAILNQNVDIKQLYDDIIKKSLYTIGEMWEGNEITVATEHLASAIVETIMSEVYFKILTHRKVYKTVVVACTENEFHQIGIKMVSDVFEMNGWHVNFLGANNTSEALIARIKEVNPDLLALSLSLPFNLPTLENMIVKIKSKFPELHILIGGQAFLHLGVDVAHKFKNIIYIPDLNTLEAFLKIEIPFKL